MGRLSHFFISIISYRQNLSSEAQRTTIVALYLVKPVTFPFASLSGYSKNVSYLSNPFNARFPYFLFKSIITSLLNLNN